MKETMNERFEEIVKETDYSEYTDKRFCCGGDYCTGDHNAFIKSFIQSEIDIAVAEERRRAKEEDYARDN